MPSSYLVGFFSAQVAVISLEAYNNVITLCIGFFNPKRQPNSFTKYILPACGIKQIFGQHLSWMSIERGFFHV